MSGHTFRRGDQVWHPALRMKGTFERRDDDDQSAAYVYFPALGETRQVIHDRLEPAGER